MFHRPPRRILRPASARAATTMARTLAARHAAFARRPGRAAARIAPAPLAFLRRPADARAVRIAPVFHTLRSGDLRLAMAFTAPAGAPAATVVVLRETRSLLHRVSERLQAHTTSVATRTVERVLAAPAGPGRGPRTAPAPLVQAFVAPRPDAGHHKPPPMVVASRAAASAPVPRDPPPGVAAPAAAQEPRRASEPRVGLRPVPAAPLAGAELSRFTDLVIRELDRRALSYRERMGRA